MNARVMTECYPQVSSQYKFLSHIDNSEFICMIRSMFDNFVCLMKKRRFSY